jgi:hydrogenase/urease accessory protein HupE
MKAIRFAAAAAAFLLPATAMAHPGAHPNDLAYDIAHIFTEPDHLLAMAMALGWGAMVVAVGVWFKPWRASSWR